MQLTVTDRVGQVYTHQVKAVLSYGSGDLLVLLDTPWARSTDVCYDPHATVAVRQVNARYAPVHRSPWREVWGDLRSVTEWALAAAEGEQVKLKGRKFTKLSPTVLPASISLPVPSSCAAL